MPEPRPGRYDATYAPDPSITIFDAIKEGNEVGLSYPSLDETLPQLTSNELLVSLIKGLGGRQMYHITRMLSGQRSKIERSFAETYPRYAGTIFDSGSDHLSDADYVINGES